LLSPDPGFTLPPLEGGVTDGLLLPPLEGGVTDGLLLPPLEGGVTDGLLLELPDEGLEEELPDEGLEEELPDEGLELPLPGFDCASIWLLAARPKMPSANSTAKRRFMFFSSLRNRAVFYEIICSV
jgi:hypothetical protein